MSETVSGQAVQSGDLLGQSVVSDPDAYYGLKGSCVGCRRVTWLCRRDRRCSKYATTPKRGHVAKPTGFKPLERRS